MSSAEVWDWEDKYDGQRWKNDVQNIQMLLFKVAEAYHLD